MHDLRYPIGEYKKPERFTKHILDTYIARIEALPSILKKEVINLNDDQLETPYRPGGWTVRQVVNHLGDSHINALIRLKCALTEDTPTIKPYREALWAELADGKHMPINAALGILEGTHTRWVVLLKHFKDADWQRGFIHPEKGRELKLNESTGMYAWHGEHHLAHITALKRRMGWK